MNKINQNLVQRFHYVGHKYWDWAYIKFKSDLQQEAALCALLYADKDYNDYLKYCSRHIRKFLKGLGYNETLKCFENYMHIEYEIIELEDNSITEVLQIELERIKHFYEQAGYTYHQICAIYHIWNTAQRLYIRTLLRQCFSRKTVAKRIIEIRYVKRQRKARKCNNCNCYCYTGQSMLDIKLQTPQKPKLHHVYVCLDCAQKSNNEKIKKVIRAESFIKGI